MSEKIEALTAATLGALQGLTEFLPVSSSGHVAIGAHLFDIRENSLALVILLHLGTLMATIVLFREDIGNLAVEGVTAVRQPSRLRATPEGRTLVAIAIATVITASMGLAMHDAAEAFAEDLRLVGYGFLVSAAALIASSVARGDWIRCACYSGSHHSRRAYVDVRDLSGASRALTDCALRRKTG